MAEGDKWVDISDSQLAAIQNETIEKCAVQAETGWGRIGPEIAEDIRRLKIPTN